MFPLFFINRPIFASVLSILITLGGSIAVFVADTTCLGQPSYGTRTWLDPEKLAVHGITVSEVTDAVSQQSEQVASSQIGQSPVANGQAYQLVMATLGGRLIPGEFENIIIKVDGQGRLVRVKDVAHTELGLSPVFLYVVDRLGLRPVGSVLCYLVIAATPGIPFVLHRRRPVVNGDRLKPTLV